MRPAQVDQDAAAHAFGGGYDPRNMNYLFGHLRVFSASFAPRAGEPVPAVDDATDLWALNPKTVAREGQICFTPEQCSDGGKVRPGAARRAVRRAARARGARARAAFPSTRLTLRRTRRAPPQEVHRRLDAWRLLLTDAGLKALGADPELPVQLDGQPLSAAQLREAVAAAHQLAGKVDGGKVRPGAARRARAGGLSQHSTDPPPDAPRAAAGGAPPLGRLAPAADRRRPQGARRGPRTAGAAGRPAAVARAAPRGGRRGASAGRQGGRRQGAARRCAARAARAGGLSRCFPALD